MNDDISLERYFGNWKYFDLKSVKFMQLFRNSQKFVMGYFFSKNVINFFSFLPTMESCQNILQANSTSLFDKDTVSNNYHFTFLKWFPHFFLPTKTKHPFAMFEFNKYVYNGGICLGNMYKLINHDRLHIVDFSESYQKWLQYEISHLKYIWYNTSTSRMIQRRPKDVKLYC